MMDEGRILMVTVGAIVTITVAGLVADTVRHSNAVEACKAVGGVYANLRGEESCLSPDLFVKVK